MRHTYYTRVSTAQDIRSAIIVQKKNARMLLSLILSTLISDWLQHVRKVQAVFELQINECKFTFASEL